MSVLRVVFFTPGLISLRALIQLDLFTWETAPPPHPHLDLFHGGGMNYLLRARINFLISCYYNYSLGFTDMILASRRQGSTAVLAGHSRCYYIDTTVLLENIPLVKFIRNYTRGSSGVFSICSPVKILITSFINYRFFTANCSELAYMIF